MAVLADVGECRAWAVRALGRQSPHSLLTPVPSWLPAHFRDWGGVFTWGDGQISLLRDLGLGTQELG